MQFELAQEMNKLVESNYETSDEMKSLCRKIISEGCVLLENDGVLPLYDKKIALFGRCQVNTFYAGYGSGGDVKSPYKVSILDGLRNNGANLNEQLMNEYIDWTSNNIPDEGWWGNWPLCFEEMPLTEEFVQNIAKDSDVAVMIIGRSAGEDRDIKLEKGSWYLNDKEIDILSKLRKYFDKLCIIINSGSIMDSSEILSFKPNALMYIWQGGQETGNGVADVLLGKVGPTGKLTDTIAKIEDYPSTNNFGHPDFNVYKEDIYVGYRYFNTFNKDKIIYPFGYGLTYSNFDIEVLNIECEYLRIKGHIKVTNTGKFNTKETIQFYLSRPTNLLGNPALELVGFYKTKELRDNEIDVINVDVHLLKYPVYDDSGITGFKNRFVLEEGEYSLYIGTDSLNVQKVISVNVEKNYVIKNSFEACAPVSSFERMVNRNGIAYENTPLKTVDIKSRILSYMPKNNDIVNDYYTYQDLKDDKVSLGKFVDSLDLEELEALTRGSLYSMDSPYGPKGNAATFGACNEKLFKRGIPSISTNDGPSGVRLACHSTQVPNGVVLASTFNYDLILDLGYQIGKEVKERNSHVLLAPGLNIHRSPLCGRNFEYYSEDPYLSGKIGSAYIRGVQKAGASACPKHFACNNQEFNRHVNDSILSQRALRDIYLKPFEICVAEAKPKVIMTSYNKINGEYSYYSHDLVRIILREEFGYKGLVITDWWMRDDESKLFENLKTQAYRIRATVDVYMPGAKVHSGEPGVIDGSIFESVKANSLTLAELRYCVSNVIKYILINEYEKMYK